MSGSGERIDGGEGAYVNPWDSVSKEPFMGKATAESVVENTAERVETKFENFIAGWQKKIAEEKQRRQDEKFENRRDERKEASDEYMAARLAREAADNSLEEAILNIREVEEDISADKDRKKELASETRYDKYVGKQAGQVGEIIKAGGEVLKAGLNKFKAEVLARIPTPKIKFESAMDMANKSWNEQQKELGSERRAAVEKVDNMKKAGEDLATTKEAFRAKIEGLGKNREERKDKLADLEKTRADLRMNKELLKSAIKERSEAEKTAQKAKEEHDKAKDSFEKAIEVFNRASDRKKEIDGKVSELEEKIKKQEGLINFQERLGNKSPVSVREELKKARAKVEAEKLDKIENVLIAADVDSVEDLSEGQRNRLEKVLKRFDDELVRIEANEKELDGYMNYRRGRVKGILGNPVGREAVRELRAA